ncbi:hypothetical protein SDJN03_20036, partial [Cucurbita argyrosperma subsp. sororia]
MDSYFVGSRLMGLSHRLLFGGFTPRGLEFMDSCLVGSLPVGLSSWTSFLGSRLMGLSSWTLVWWALASWASVHGLLFGGLRFMGLSSWTLASFPIPSNNMMQQTHGSSSNCLKRMVLSSDDLHGIDVGGDFCEASSSTLSEREGGLAFTDNR